MTDDLFLSPDDPAFISQKDQIQAEALDLIRNSDEYLLLAVIQEGDDYIPKALWTIRMSNQVPLANVLRHIADDFEAGGPIGEH